MNETTITIRQPMWRRPEYRGALLIFVAVLAGYVWTLAPTVTFWDAGEFLAAGKILGIPHPPGTPVFVFVSNVWARLIPFGGYAYRVNLMTAVFSATAAAFLFLVVLHTLRGHRSIAGTGTEADTSPVFVYGGAAAAALCSAFVFTIWQNSNESEVYTVSSLCIAASAWLGWLWRQHRGTARGAHMLLILVYVGAFAIGNHLMTLLVGPAFVVYMWHVLRTQPLEDPTERQIEWSQWAVLGATWTALIGIGLGATILIGLAAVLFLAATAYAASVGSIRFPLAVLGVSAVGVSTYLFLYIRAGLHPFINEADPSTWDKLLAVIRREQYPPRSPLDNPVFPSGPTNPGRSFAILRLQILNYLQYFDWQWANGLAPTKPVFEAVRLPFTLVFTSLGILGMAILKRTDKSIFWLLVGVFLITGPGLVAYMNFKPGFSIATPLFPEPDQHEVRERDYFFLISFQMWGLFSGIGIAGLFQIIRDQLRASTQAARSRLLASPVWLLACLPFVLNFNAASRAHGPETTLARDFAYDLLQTIEPYGIVFTNGDNDTFPLWYAQEVEGIRQDVSVVNLSLGNTDWYIQQLRDNPIREFRPEQAPWFAGLAKRPAKPLHSWTDDEIASLIPQALPSAFRFHPQGSVIDKTFPAGSPLYVKDMLILRLIAENVGTRPVYFSTTAGSGNWNNLDDYLVQEGLALKLYSTGAPDLARMGQGLLGAPVDIPRTDSLVWDIYRYAGLFDADSLDLEPTDRNIASNLSLPHLTLYRAYEGLGDRENALRNLRRAYHLTPSPDLRRLLEATEYTPSIGSDSAQEPASDSLASDSLESRGTGSN
jgi:Protein O-mannosyl-transferase TMEM260-like